MSVARARDVSNRSRGPLTLALALAMAGAALAGVPLSTAQAVASLGTPTSYPVQDEPSSVAVADLNGDTYADLAVTNSASLSVSILLGDASGGFGAASHVTTLPGAGRIPTSVAAGDLNGDTHRDLVVGFGGIGLAGTVQVLLGTGTGTFAAPVTHAAGNDPWAVVTGSLTGDAFPDIAVANKNSDTVSVLAGNGAGGFGAPVAFDVGERPTSIVAADLNGDSRTDLVTANAVTNNISVLLANDAGSFAAAAGIALGSDPIALAVGNLDGNATMDLVVADDVDGTVTVLLNDGAAAFSMLPPIATGSGAGAVAIGDLNDDSFADVAVGNYFGDTVSVLTGNGTGAVGSKVDYPSEAPYAVAAARLGSDATTDLLSVNEGTDDVTVRLAGGGAVLPNLRGSPTSLSFGNQKVRTQGAGQTIMVINDGSSGAPIDFVGIAGAALDDFPRLASECDGVVLPPGAACAVTVAFRPSAAGVRNAEIVVVPGGETDPIGIPISGTGVQARISKVAVSGPAEVARGKPATYTVRVTNAGTLPATGVKLTASGRGVSAGVSVGTIAAGATKSVKLRVRPKATGRVKVTFKATSTGAGTRAATKTLTVGR